MSKQEPTCDACGHLVSEHNDKGCTVELDSAWTASGGKPCGCSRRRNDPRNVRKLGKSEQDEIMRNAADVYVNTTPPPPATGEGPYSKRHTGRKSHGVNWFDLVGPGIVPGEHEGDSLTLNERVKYANMGHSRALASNSDAVRELVRAARIALAACEIHPYVRAEIDQCVPALRSALAKFKKP